MAAIIHRQQNPDGTVTIFYDDRTSITVGTPVDPVARARQAGQASVAQTQAIYGDPWYQEHVIAPMERATAQAAQEKAQALRNQAIQLAMQGRQMEANIANQQAQIEMRKAELVLGANRDLAAMRGPGNAAAFIDLQRRQRGFGIQSNALAEMAAGRMPTGAFGAGGSGKPISMQDRMSGMLGAPSQEAIEQRDRNDRGLANQIFRNAGQLARGSYESLSPYEREYLAGYAEAEGWDAKTFEDQYRRAGIQQGRR